MEIRFLGDKDSFSGIVKIYLKSVYNFVYRFVNDQDVAENLTQEVFVKTWENLHKLDASKNFRTWIFAIAKNTVFDWQYFSFKVDPLNVFVFDLAIGHRNMDGVCDKIKDFTTRVLNIPAREVLETK